MTSRPGSQGSCRVAIHSIFRAAPSMAWGAAAALAPSASNGACLLQTLVACDPLPRLLVLGSCFASVQGLCPEPGECLQLRGGSASACGSRQFTLESENSAAAGTPWFSLGSARRTRRSPPLMTLAAALPPTHEPVHPACRPQHHAAKRWRAQGARRHRAALPSGPGAAP